ncbi:MULTISPECIES: hypothetical protein [Paenibacillus]|uniref:hypothetical protein n=1 Tax=Paenibacillus TaxID=44249 RepID=UPI00041F90D1|nr:MULTISPECIES: hypothetical protein [Paenibacillus]KGP77450.1 hypothetical protein P364_0133030 [Paenibacillus sp. MAEPY2]KGP78139.1 hypothetical protein P363_0132500 [Paenibacillus sp. MAEPY1]OZQ58910.1 hypothetical protein CA599_31425 [Paenibacillus taichungensis]SFT00557.1 hypothetical protein SAMN04488601_11916 [Paenibacillus sp. 453mf]
MHANNQFYQLLNNKSNNDQMMVTFNRRPQVIGSEDAGMIAVDDSPLDMLMAEVQAVILAQEGVLIPPGISDHMREILVSSYLLHAGLCVVQVNTKHGVG